MTMNKQQAGSSQKDAAESGSSEEVDSEDDPMPASSWSGLAPSSRQSSFELSEQAVACWAGLIAIDEQGKKDLRFKKVPKYPNKIKYYTEVL